MTMDYLTDIKPLEDQGLTDQQIVDTLTATGVMNNKIKVVDLLHILNEEGMMRRITWVDPNDPMKKWNGSIMKMQEVIFAGGNPIYIDGIEKWMSHVTNPKSTYWDTTDPKFAAPFWAMVLMFADQPEMPTTANFDAVIDLGGGWKWADLTVDQVAIARAGELEKSRVNSLQAILDECNNMMTAAIANGDDATTFRAAIKAGL